MDTLNSDVNVSLLADSLVREYVWDLGLKAALVG
jgi:hypothetical protein